MARGRLARRMDIPVEVPGLDSLVPQIQGGRVVVSESGPDPAKSFFIRRICRTALRLEVPVSFVTSRGQDEVEALFRGEGEQGSAYSEALHVVEKDELRDFEEVPAGDGVLAVDSFTLLTLDLASVEIAHLMRRFRALCRDRGTTVLLATDRGVQAPSAEAVTNYLSDGVVQFHSKEGPEGISRFLRIPKWTDGKFVDRNVYYDFDGKRMAIDLRRRVI
jgi:KaiC/GvpD/RAD55 family RecA-like ATPase